MARLQLVKAFVNAMWRRNVVVAHVQRKRVAVDLAIKTGMLPNGLQFRGKNKIFSYPPVIQWLDAQPVTNQEQLAFLAVPKGESKHANKTLKCCIHAPAFNSFQHHFSIGMAAPSTGPKFRADFFKVVDFAIEHNDVSAGGRVHRLMPFRREIDNREPAERQADSCRAVMEGARIIRPTMRQGSAHLIQGFQRVFRSAFCLPESSNSTHKVSMRK